MTWKYDIVSLIELVESKPCIWDKTNEDSKNKLLREKNWKEIVECLDDGYINMSKEEQKKTSDMIMTKWRHIRDAFARSLRSKTGHSPKRSYMYAQYLQFLQKNSEPCDTDSFCQDSLENVEEECGVSNPTSPEPWAQSASMFEISNGEGTSSHMRQMKTTNKRDLDPGEREILTQLKKTKSIEQDHELVLLSFLPYMKDMTEAELMEFQMDTLCTIKRIKDKRNYLSTSPTGSTVFCQNIIPNCSTPLAALQSAATGCLKNSQQKYPEKQFSPP